MAKPIKISGRKMGSIRAVRSSVKKGSGGFLIKGVPTDGIVVRYLTEPDGWFGYNEHYDNALKVFYPCIEGTCPGCEEGLTRSYRYLANALHVDEDKVIALKLAKTLANKIMLKYDKYGTIMDRDYELTRIGEGFDTEYDSEPLAVKKRLLKKYKLFDLLDVLEKAFQQAFGDEEEEDDDEDDEEETPRSRKVGGRPAKKPVRRSAPTGTRRAAKKPVARKPVKSARRPIRRTR
jgi:hypothetical protein